MHNFDRNVRILRLPVYTFIEKLFDNIKKSFFFYLS